MAKSRDDLLNESGVDDDSMRAMIEKARKTPRGENPVLDQMRDFASGADQPPAAAATAQAQRRQAVAQQIAAKKGKTVKRGR